MERIQKTVEIALSREECEILAKAEQLIVYMAREIQNIQTPLCKDDLTNIMKCYDALSVITSRYSVHTTLDINIPNIEME